MTDQDSHNLLRKPRPASPNRAMVAGGASLVIGATLLITVLASGVFGSSYLSAANLTPGAQVISSAGASSGKAVVFGVTQSPPTPQPTQTPSPTRTPTPAPTATATPSNLIFDDEFSGAAGSAPDASKWSALNDDVAWGIQCFVNDRNHVAIDGNGHLVETATYSSSGSPCGSTTDYESGGLTTGAAVGGLFDFKYGTIVASIKVPCQSGTGLWPAFWSDGNAWPAGGEIDYLEVMDGQGPDNAEQSLHGPSSSGHWNIDNSNVASSPWCGAYHTYGAIWSSGKIQFTIDGVVTHTITPSNVPSGGTWPFDTANERILLDLQVGNSGGTPVSSTFPQSMDVDYVRVYSN
jgi:beta-glucanase (GH16 family)